MKSKASSKKSKGLKRLPVGFIAICTLPSALLTIYFTLLPTFSALRLSFTNATSLDTGKAKFVGLENYKYMFGDKHFLQALGNTLKLMLVAPVLILAVALVLAFILSQSKLREKAFYRTVFFFPSVISLTVVGIVWSFIFHPTMGILNTLLEGIGLQSLAKPWLGDSTTALWCIAATLVWQAAGYYMVMHIAAMDSISYEIYEAATIDGAGNIRKMFSITLPLIKDIIGVTYVLALSSTINLSYVLSNVMTAGGPSGSSTVLLQYIYNQGMASANYGYAMSITVFTLFISVVLSLLSRYMTGRQER